VSSVYLGSAVRVFDVSLEPSMVEEIAAHGEREYPVEACGLILGRPRTNELVRAVPMKNVQDKYHRRDPHTFPRDGRDAFRLDELERMRLLESARSDGLVERVLYHSHCDAGAYFSPEDRAMAVQQGVEMMPGVVHVVVSIRGGRRVDMAAFRFDPARSVFEEARIPLRGERGLPDLELRVMEGREAVRPIRPVGGVLAPRRVSSEEAQRMEQLTDKVQIRLESEESIRDIRRLELGLLSPLTGFLRTVEARSIGQSGRLLSGTPWRTPLLLELAAKKSALLPSAGALIGLVDKQNRPLAAMGLTEVVRAGKDVVRLAGPVYVYDGGEKGDAAETRAELLRRGMRRVLAIGRQFQRDVERGVDLSAFDGVLSAFPIPGVECRLDFVLAGREPWLDAVIAQNQGATHIWVEDPVLALTIEESLAIEPWRPHEADVTRAPPPGQDLRILEADQE
jgi:proteasome lid subunit RPN8/RPN11